MNDYFETFIKSSRTLAEHRGLTWMVRLGDDGSVRTDDIWDLSALVSAPAPRALLADLGDDAKCLAHLTGARAPGDYSAVRSRAPLSTGWQELLKAVAIDQVLVRRNNPTSATNNVVRPLRVIATIAHGVEPWDLSRETAELACAIAAGMQPSGKLGELVVGVLRDIIDRNHLADRCPLLPTSMLRRTRLRNASPLSDSPALRQHLNERKNGERLPEARALWELVRIILTEKPKTFMDAIRFAQALIELLCGFRIGEGILVPADWRRYREYVDTAGNPAGESGGISRSLGMRHFAEKRRGLTVDSVALFEAVQHVPAMFEKLLIPALETVERITKPLRDRLRAQTETGRLFPEYEVSDLMPAVEFFVRFFGTLEVKEEDLPPGLLAKYRATWDPNILDELRASQVRSTAPLRGATKSAWSKLNMRHPLPEALSADGLPSKGGNIPWSRSFFRVADLEEYVPRVVPTKMPDRTPLRLADGSPLFPHELLFLGPKRALIEERNDGLCDLGLYFSVGGPSKLDLHLFLGGRDEPNCFTRYGKTDEDRALSINSHSLRHLQTTELYRLGISELAIVKRFNRTGIPENREYKHLTLAEDLDAIDLPAGAEKQLGPQAQATLRLITGGKLRGPLVEEFRRIQRQDGEQAALAFLQVEADGFHATPYGYCLTSLLVNPCSTHAECFNGCRHLSLSPLHEHRGNLEWMRATLRIAVDRCMELPEGHLGRDRQLEAAKVRLSNVERALAMSPGDRPFPDGKDLSTALGA
jgi:hypothetical protein